jgi:hypothetical protein
MTGLPAYKDLPPAPRGQVRLGRRLPGHRELGTFGPVGVAEADVGFGLGEAR